MKRKIFYLILGIISVVAANAQSSDSILYILPDKVELLLDEYQETISTTAEISIYLTKIDNENYQIFVSATDKEDRNYFVTHTNRFVVLHNKRIALYLDYDCKFSTIQPNNIGEFGKRDGYVLKSYIISEGYNITFDITGENIKEDYGIMKKKKKRKEKE